MSSARRARPRVPLLPHQRHEREDPALAAVVGAHDEREVLERDDEGQRPEHEREHAEDVLVRGRHAVRPGEALLQRVERARPDVAVDDAERPQGQSPPAPCRWVARGARRRVPRRRAGALGARLQVGSLREGAWDIWGKGARRNKQIRNPRVEPIRYTRPDSHGNRGGARPSGATPSGCEPRRRPRVGGRPASTAAGAGAAKGGVGYLRRPSMPAAQPLGAELRALFRLAVPLAVAQGGQALMGVVDTAVVGRAGAVPLAGTGLGNSLFFAVAVLGMGIMHGFDPLVSQAVGAGDTARARRLLWQAAWLSVGLTAGARGPARPRPRRPRAARHRARGGTGGRTLPLVAASRASRSSSSTSARAPICSRSGTPAAW